MWRTITEWLVPHVSKQRGDLIFKGRVSNRESRSTVLLEKPISLQLIKKFPAFYWARMFTTAFTRARHLSLSWAR
jgi:hypothetical protein